MIRSKVCVILALTAISFGWHSLTAAETDQAIGLWEFQGKPLEYWVEQASSETVPVELEGTVSALSDAVRSDNPSIKVVAADALANLGSLATAALPALLDQFDHEFPWVRVSCQAAVGAMGQDAVDGLIDTFKNSTGGPRICAAFVLGGIGPDAQAAVPVILESMQEESPAVRERLAGVLRQIDPEQFDNPRGTTGGDKGQVTLDQIATNPAIATRDWPQFHGPARDSICREEGLLKEWPADGPKLLWTLEGLGRGYSTVSIAGGKLFTMGDRKVDAEEAQSVIAFDLATRTELWCTRIGAPHEDGGPRCTPTVDGDRVYAIGTDGDLVCLNVADGQLVWRKNFVEDYQGQFMSVWKFSESPLVDGDRLICTPGGPDATIVALNKHNGQELWKCAIPDLGEKGADGAGYSSAVVAEIRGVRQYVQLVGRGVIGVEAATGRFLWGYNQIANNVANITSPSVRGDYVFASTAYNTGSVLLRIDRTAQEFQASEVYFIHPKDFQNHHGGVVLLGDYIYGGHGPNRGGPACVELATGEVVWKERAPATGSAAVLYADGHLIYRYDRGDVLLIEASPKGLNIKGRFTAPDDEGPAWPHPVIHDGKLYLRHANLLLCYDVRAF